MNQFMKLAALSMIALSIVACGNSGKKKKGAANRGHQDKTADSFNTNTDALQDRDQLFQKRIERRLHFENEFAPQVYYANKEDQGVLKIIFLPANPQSLNKSDHKALWFFNPKNDDETGIDAYIVDVQASDDLKKLPFPLAPYDEEQQSNNDSKLISELQIVDKDSLRVNCGEVSRLFSRDRIATADNMKFHTLTEENEDYFKSPCSLFLDLMNKTEEAEDITTADDADQDESHNDNEAVDQDIPISHCDDSQEETVTNEQGDTDTQYIQSVGTIKIKGIIRCYHNTGKCVVIHSEILNHGHGHTTKPHSCVYTLEQPTETLPEVTQGAHHTHSHEIESVLLSDTDLPYCSSLDQRIYLKKQDRTESLKKEVLRNVKYCELRPELGELCRAKEMHKLYQRIERHRKQMGKILKRCHKGKVKQIAGGNHGRPEINTCGPIKRAQLKRQRINEERLQEKISDLEVNCQLDNSMCSSKKMTRLKRILHKKQASIAKKEKVCRTYL